jgi:hypothetical protein
LRKGDRALQAENISRIKSFDLFKGAQVETQNMRAYFRNTPAFNRRLNGLRPAFATIAALFT